MLIDELQRIQITCDNDDIGMLGRRLGGEGAEYVIRLVSGGFIDGDVECLHDLANTRKLRAHRVGQGWAVRLVGGVIVMAEGRRGQVERDRDVFWLDVAKEVEQDARKAKDSVCRLALIRAHLLGIRMERAMEERMAIEQCEGVLCGNNAVSHANSSSLRSLRMRRLAIGQRQSARQRLSSCDDARII